LSASIANVVASIAVGVAIGAATLVGLINSQTAAPSESPANVETVAIDYGS
jgi:hypothetical protein